MYAKQDLYYYVHKVRQVFSADTIKQGLYVQ